jgi:hypothetical protein
MLQRTTVHHVTQDIGSTMDFVLTLYLILVLQLNHPNMLGLQ